MSFVAKGIKKAFKAVTKFVKKYWKPILIAAAVVFTAGLATVGFSGFSGAMASGGFWSAVGSTMKAGFLAGVKTFTGLGPGAQGAAAIHGGVQGAGLFSGALGQTLGLAAKTGPRAAAGVGASGGVGAGVGAGGGVGANIGAGTGVGGSAGASSALNTGLTVMQGGGNGGIGQAMKQLALIQAGTGFISNYMAAKAREDEIRREEELRDEYQFYGLDRGGRIAGTEEMGDSTDTLLAQSLAPMFDEYYNRNRPPQWDPSKATTTGLQDVLQIPGVA